MYFLNKLGFTGRFDAIKIGVLINASKISPSIQLVINSLLNEHVDFLLIDIKRGYIVREGYFDLIIVDSYIDEIYDFYQQIELLTFNGCLLLQTIDEANKIYKHLPYKFQGALTVSSDFDQTTYKGFLYKNER